VYASDGTLQAAPIGVTVFANGQPTPSCTPCPTPQPTP
jgi:hypothetical protein